MQSIPRELAATAFVFECEGCATNDERGLLVERVQDGHSQFFVGRSINSMRPATPSFISSNICYFTKKFPGLRFYTRQIPVTTLFSVLPENADLPKQVNVDLRRILNSKPMDFPGAEPWKEAVGQHAPIQPADLDADLDSHGQKS